MKPMLSTKELIEHMKEKGITFRETSEKEAMDFLENNNYYMKLAAYRANYEKCAEGKRKGMYQNLDFAYLQELSRLDMHLRHLVLEMCLDIEHVIKVRLVDLATKDPQEDGYDIVRRFLAEEGGMRVLEGIRRHKAGEYCKDLIAKYYPYFPIWVFVELISFGDLLYFCYFCEKRYNVKIVNRTLMNTVRDVRNASAHSNCLLNKMTERIDATKQVNSEISNFIGAMPEISKTSRVNNMNCKFTNSFITLLYVYDCLMPVNSRKKRYEELQEFLEGRVVRHKEYFRTNTKIVGVYKFQEKVIKNLLTNT